MSDRFLVSEMFGPTIQGEGAMIGVQTNFIRFAGCDYKCRMCDSMHAVDPELIHKNAMRLAPQDFLLRCHDLAQRTQNILWCTLSGGNPCIWDLAPVIREMRAYWDLAVETQGTIWQDWLYDVQQLTISPKGPGMGEKFDAQVLDDFIMKSRKHYVETCLKVVIFNDEDLGLAEFLMEKYKTIPMYLSLGNVTFNLRNDLEYTRDELLQGYEALVNRVMNNYNMGRAIILPQLHTLIWGNKQGV